MHAQNCDIRINAKEQVFFEIAQFLNSVRSLGHVGASPNMVQLPLQPVKDLIVFIWLLSPLLARIE